MSCVFCRLVLSSLMSVSRCWLAVVEKSPSAAAQLSLLVYALMRRNLPPTGSFAAGADVSAALPAPLKILRQ